MGRHESLPREARHTDSLILELMKPNLDSLARHYASLSDEALLDIDPSELTEAAQSVLQEEIQRRRLTATDIEFEIPESGEPLSAASAEHADWEEEASVVYSILDLPGANAAESADSALHALRSAGIPCQMETVEPDPDEEPVKRTPAREFRVLVPGHFNLQAASTIDRDIFNNDFESEWINHLESVSDEEVLAMKPEVVFCGLYDRINRIVKAYKAELAARRLS